MFVQGWRDRNHKRMVVDGSRVRFAVPNPVPDSLASSVALNGGDNARLLVRFGRGCNLGLAAGKQATKAQNRCDGD